jgi:hypothetical protein
MAITVTPLMTITPTVKPDETAKTLVIATVLFDSGYPAGGEAVVASDFGLSNLNQVIVGSIEGDATAAAWWDTSASKLALTEEDATTGISVDFATTDASAITATVLVLGDL